MINSIKIFLNKMIELWQSKDKNYANLKDGGIALLAFAIACFALPLILVMDSRILTYISKYTFTYMGSIILLISINFLSFYFYVYNNKKSLRNSAKFFTVLMVIFLLITLIATIPFTVVLGGIGNILDFRAKKINNLIGFMRLLAITLIIVSSMIYPNYIIAYKFSTALGYILNIKCMFNLDVFPVCLFILIGLFMFEVNIIFKLLILITRMWLNRNKMKKVKFAEKRLERNSNIISIENIRTYRYSKSNKIIEIADYSKKELEYDVNYLEKTLKKVELAILIILFIVIAFKMVPFELLAILEKNHNEAMSDAINVLTIYTLVMLYMDKRLEWK